MHCERSETIFLLEWSFAMQTIGILLTFIILISAAIPPLSDDPETPSTSSITMTVFWFFKWSIVEFALKSLSKDSITFFDLLSEAFITWHENPKCLAINLTSEVFPMPGGPDIKQARAFVF